MKRQLLLAIVGLLCSVQISASSVVTDKDNRQAFPIDTTLDKNAKAQATELVGLVISTLPAEDAKTRYDTLTDADFAIVAKELGVEVAAIKAVVKIEAGPKLQGFWAPGVPVINYAQSLFNQYSGKVKGRKIKDGKVPSGLSGYALKEWTSLTNARKINADAADMGT
ncbi:MAG: N-acetylmuramidase domain-containing protein [Muribaculaceae bacterium]|nr:N-acetylmuramidase domain-containing protein [Muribaculaceae bacterium]